MTHRIWWAWMFGAVLAGCGDVPVINVPPDVPPVVNPPNPTPDNPPAPGSGAITEDQFNAVIEDATLGADGAPRVGTSEENLVKSLGPPFNKRTVAGMTKYLYLLADPHVAWFFVQNGKVVRKNHL